MMRSWQDFVCGEGVQQGQLVLRSGSWPQEQAGAPGSGRGRPPSAVVAAGVFSSCPQHPAALGGSLSERLGC